MRIGEILLERLVKSSWLQDVTYHSRQNQLFPGEEIITFKVKKNPKLYIVRGLTRKDYIDWINSPSKGKFYHYIKKKFARGWYQSNPFRITDTNKIRPNH